MTGREGGAGSRVLRFRNWSWEGVPARPYGAPGEGGDARDIVRRVLAEGGTLDFELRYFEVAPGGRTSLERHRHEHVVLVLRGRGTVRLGGEEHPLSFGDLVRVAPDELHQFRNDDPEEPFGFLCIVDRVRDRPRRG